MVAKKVGDTESVRVSMGALPWDGPVGLSDMIEALPSGAKLVTATPCGSCVASWSRTPSSHRPPHGGTVRPEVLNGEVLRVKPEVHAPQVHNRLA